MTPIYGLGSRQKRAYHDQVDVLDHLQSAEVSSLTSPHFARPGLLLAVLGEPTHRHDALNSALTELLARELVSSHLPLRTLNLLSGLAHGCLGPPQVGCTVVLPVALCGADPTGLRLLSEPGHHHLLGIRADRQADARLLAQELHVPLWPLGRTTGQELVIRLSEGTEEEPFPTVLRVPLAMVRQSQPPQ